MRIRAARKKMRDPKRSKEEERIQLKESDSTTSKLSQRRSTEIKGITSSLRLLLKLKKRLRSQQK